MKALLVARKSLLEILREPQLPGLVILLPVIFVVISAFTYNYPILSTYRVQVIDPDPSGGPLVEELRAGRYADGRPVFEITTAEDREAAETALKKHSAAALLVVSPAESGALDVTIRGDALYMPFYRASLVIENTVDAYNDRATGRPEVLRVAEESVFAGGPRSDFELYTPGMMMFALMLLIPQTAMLVSREIRWGTLRRLRLTSMSAWDLLAGIGLSQMVVAVVQVLVTFVTALAFGFQSRGSLLTAVLVGLGVSFSSVGLGLVVACFVENDSQATNVGSSVSMLQVLLSGSFYRLPPLTVFTVAGHQIDLFDVFPATHGLSALQQVLAYGAGLKDIGFRFGVMLVLSLVYLAVGVFIFGRTRMSRET